MHPYESLASFLITTYGAQSIEQKVTSIIIINMATASAEKFAWSDEEMEALLEATIEYKVTKESQSLDWETVRTKYDDIAKIYAENNSNRKKIDTTRVAAKMKTIRKKYKDAIDAGRRSGGGRIVTMFYDLCSKLWAGSPSVLSLESGK